MMSALESALVVSRALYTADDPLLGEALCRVGLACSHTGYTRRMLAMRDELASFQGEESKFTSALKEKIDEACKAISMWAARRAAHRR
jgi:hypothetical protein